MTQALEDGPFILEEGKLINKTWKIVGKLGQGGCGAVYEVENTKTGARAALKAESNYVAGGTVLKLEAEVLKKLVNHKFVARMLAEGKKKDYCYMVMTLFGDSLHELFKKCGKKFKVPTQVRLGMQILYGLKQLHEVGYIHRDLKPANLAIGREGIARRVLHLLDFGLSRKYVALNAKGELYIKPPRESTLFRGTIKYCSANTHTKAEQGRPDDLWSMVYVLAEMSAPLPWAGLKEKEDIHDMKNATSDAKLFENSHKDFVKIPEHLRSLNYKTRPDYGKMYDVFAAIFKELHLKYSDPLDWEEKEKTSKTPSSPQSKTRSNNKKNKKKIKTIEQDQSIEQKTAEAVSSVKKASTDRVMQDENDAPFTAADFKNKELNF